MTDVKQRPFKAWYVSDGEYSEVVFAETRGKAKLMPDFSNESDFVALKATRAPAFDGIQETLTSRHYLERGFHVACARCEQMIYADNGPLYSEYGEAYCKEDCFAKGQVACN